jgi:hypothetical protein
LCTGQTTSFDPSLGIGVNFGVGHGMVDGVAGTSISMGVEASFTAISGGFSYSYATPKTDFGGVGFSIAASVSPSIGGLDFGAS